MIDGLGDALVAWLPRVNAWTMVLLVLAMGVDRALARRARASLRLALYLPVALRVILPTTWTIAVPGATSRMLLMPVQALTAGASTVHALSWHAAAAIGYLAVAGILGALSLSRRQRLARALKSARVLESVAAPCKVLVHAELGPMVVGLLEPRIVLPAAMVEGAEAPAVWCVLRHEIAHVKRGDPWLTAGIDLLLVFAWPVLPLWIAAARVRHLVELACDEAALAGADASERRRYGHVLLDFAEHGTLALAGAGSLHFGSTLRARVEAIALHRPMPRAVQAGLVSVAVLGFAACSSTGPGSLPQATGTARPAAAGAMDEYGYQYEDDSLAAKPGPAPSAATDANGRLAPEVIQNTVRASFGRFRTCYEDGLKLNSKLEGTATVSFVIDPSGAVRDASNRGSTLPDDNVVKCVVSGFAQLSFPPPQGGYVTVVYPIVFAP